MRLIIHNFYSKESPSGENNVVNQEKDQFTHRFFAFSDTVMREKSLFKRIFYYTKYKSRVKKRIKKTLSTKFFEEIVIHNTFPFIDDDFLKLIDPKTRVTLRLHNYRSLVTCGTLNDKHGKLCDLCIRKPVRLSPLVLVWKCYNGSISKSILVYIKILKLFFSGCLGRVDKVLYFSEYQKNIVKDLFRSDACWEKKLNQVIRSKKIPMWENKGSQNRYIFIGRLSNEKGLNLLINTWEDWSSGLQLDVYGAGPLEGLVREKTECSNINFRGYLHEGNKYDVMKDGGILLFPSQCIEGHPLLIEEAKVINMPGLVSNIGPLSEYTVNCNLKLIDFRSPNLRSILSEFHTGLVR